LQEELSGDPSAGREGGGPGHPELTHAAKDPHAVPAPPEKMTDGPRQVEESVEDRGEWVLEGTSL